jgi:hypothetical protein
MRKTNLEENKNEMLDGIVIPADKLEWVTKNSAMLVVHGIGDQLPLETLDAFGRGLVKQYKKKFQNKISLTHVIVSKPGGSGGEVWFDNVVRISCEGSDKIIDLYEYYWANYTQDQASSKDISAWLSQVAKSASSFYSESKNSAMGKKYHDSSPLFDSRGRFKRRRYKRFLFLIRSVIPFLQSIASFFLKLISQIPGIGETARGILEDKIENLESSFDNIIGDIVVYNVSDPKSKFYRVKREIMDGGVKALKFLIENNHADGNSVYDSVIVAGHSLGTQVSYDAINKINLLINQDKIESYTAEGIHKVSKKHISVQLCGYVTFGSPLDKIAFFLRESVPDTLYLRQQLMDDYHGFKQRDWSLNNQEGDYTRLHTSLHRMLDTIEWRNYHDKNDYVSGPLDYYKGVRNIDCAFGGKSLFSFTHSNYWEHEKFYLDVIHTFLK